jgi:hypothetical protein
MKTKGMNGKNPQDVDPMRAANELMKLYCAAHSDSPSAVRRPRLFIRDQLWVALLGPSAEEGVVGIGPTVEAALRSFDLQYQSRSPTPKSGS